MYFTFGPAGPLLPPGPPGPPGLPCPPGASGPFPGGAVPGGPPKEP